MGDYTQYSDTSNICSYTRTYTNVDFTLSLALFCSHFVVFPLILSFDVWCLFNEHLSFCLSFHFRHFSCIFANRHKKITSTHYGQLGFSSCDYRHYSFFSSSPFEICVFFLSTCFCASIFRNKQFNKNVVDFFLFCCLNNAVCNACVYCFALPCVAFLLLFVYSNFHEIECTMTH